MDRYYSKRRDFGTRLIQLAVLLTILGLIGLIGLYQSSPRPFKREFFQKFLIQKITLPLQRTLAMRPLDPRESKLPVMELTIDENVWKKIEHNPLRDGRHWQSAYLSYQADVNIPVNFKIRGGQSFSSYHWGGIKKSLWIKTKAGVKIDDGKRFTLTNFKNPIYTADAIGYDWGKTIGLLGPEHNFLTVYLNKQKLGVFHKIDYFDKYWLQKSERISGDIYSLDDVPSFIDSFTQLTYWEKKAHNRKEKKENNKNLQRLLTCLNSPECDQLPSLVRIDKFLSHNILFELLNSTHSDNFHNQRIYNDPSLGRFEPIVWDIWPDTTPREYNQSYHILDQKILLSPKYRMRKFELQNEILHRQLTENEITEKINYYRNLLNTDLVKDRYLGGNIPFSHKEWLEMLSSYETLLKKRRKDMLAFINSPESIQLKQIKSKYVLSSTKQAHFTITDIHTKKGELRSIEGMNLPITLIEAWSGYREEQPSPIGPKVWYKLKRSPIVFSFTPSSPITSIGIRNSITGEKFRIKPQQSDTSTDLINYSVVPPKDKKQIITFSAGVHNIKSNRFYGPSSVLHFKPGAIVKMSPGVSIHTEGRVYAEGTSTKPVIFRSARSGHYWGTFSLSGKEADGSYFKHVHFSGGKDAILKTVFYSGMVNCYHAQCDFDQCHFSDNKGDDALNIKSSTTKITNSIFYKTAFDAIDLDFTDGVVENNIIYKTGNDGFDLGTGHAHVKNNIIYQAGDKGISSGERSFPLVTGNILEKNNIGVAIKDESEVLIIGNLFKENKTTISAYQKKTEFGGSHPILINNLMENNQKLIDHDPQSYIDRYGNIAGTNFITGFSAIQQRPSQEWISKLKILSNRKLKPLNELVDQYSNTIHLDRYEELKELIKREK